VSRGDCRRRRRPLAVFSLRRCGPPLPEVAPERTRGERAVDTSLPEHAGGIRIAVRAGPVAVAFPVRVAQWLTQDARQPFRSGAQPCDGQSARSAPDAPLGRKQVAMDVAPARPARITVLPNLPPLPALLVRQPDQEPVVACEPERIRKRRAPKLGCAAPRVRAGCPRRLGWCTGWWYGSHDCITWPAAGTIRTAG